ncbi:MAG: excinuclease ABC subunit C [Aureliella sp.]
MTISFDLVSKYNPFGWRICDIPVLVVVVWFAVSACAAAQETSTTENLHATKPALPTPELEKTVALAFSVTHDGWSSDEVLLMDGRRKKFVDQCRELTQQRGEPLQDEDAYCRALLHIRKSGGKLPRATKRAKSSAIDSVGVSEAELLAASEIAARKLSDQLHCHTDAILVDSAARTFFDQQAKKICPASPYALRKAALRLRKTRRLEPELLSRVADWKLQVVEHSVIKLRTNLELVPKRPGIYLFRDKSGYLYIGQASDLRNRLTSHLTDSDRRALSDYLNRNDASEITVELHVFQKGSPGEKLRTRRAYESELIRTRSPRLNLAP